VGGVPSEQAIETLRLASHKLPVPTKTVLRDRLGAIATGGSAYGA
jgi:ribosomal protein L16/L10AE